MATSWSYKANIINACNCDWGCPCNFNAKPTNGSCEGGWSAHITDGICGDTRLDGMKFALLGRWPGAVHEGRATAKIWMDESARAEQRSALEDILKGKFGGMPWVIIAATVDTWLDTAYVPFEWNYEETRSSVNAGNQIRITLDTMKNPVSGLDATATILLPNGIITKELHATDPPPLKFSNRGCQYAFLRHGGRLAGFRVLSAVCRIGRRMLASDGGSAEVVHALVTA